MIIGYVRRGGPEIIGEFLGEVPEILVGSPMEIYGVRFKQSVCYKPDNERKKKLVKLLEPRQSIPESFWLNELCKRV